jgi:hypothetical protein
VKVGHGHCKDCGTCLINGYTQKNHTCDKPNAPAVAEVMRLDMMTTASRTRWRNTIGAKEELMRA